MVIMGNKASKRADEAKRENTCNCAPLLESVVLQLQNKCVYMVECGFSFHNWFYDTTSKVSPGFPGDFTPLPRDFTQFNGVLPHFPGFVVHAYYGEEQGGTVKLISPGFPGFYLHFPGNSPLSPGISPHLRVFFTTFPVVLTTFRWVCCVKVAVLRCIARECSEIHVPRPHASKFD